MKHNTSMAKKNACSLERFQSDKGTDLSNFFVSYGFHLPNRMQPNLDTYQEIDCSLSGAKRPGFGISTFTSSSVSASPKYRKVIRSQSTSRRAKLTPLLPNLRVVISRLPFGRELKSTKPYCAESLGTGISLYSSATAAFSIGASPDCVVEVETFEAPGADSLPHEARRKQKINGNMAEARISSSYKSLSLPKTQKPSFLSKVN
jgi:hypothetical protein